MPDLDHLYPPSSIQGKGKKLRDSPSLFHAFHFLRLNVEFSSYSPPIPSPSGKCKVLHVHCSPSQLDPHPDPFAFLSSPT